MCWLCENITKRGIDLKAVQRALPIREIVIYGIYFLLEV